MSRLAILISGAGSNLRAIIEAHRGGHISGEIALVLADRPAAGLEIARACSIEAQCIPAEPLASREAHDTLMLQQLRHFGIDQVVLAGYMRILTPQFVETWLGRMLNIHPSLLPAHKGLHTHRRVLQAGDTMHGTTVHFVSPDLDGGPPVLQAQFSVRAQDTEQSLRARVQRCEHEIYPEAIRWLTSGRLTLHAGDPWLDGDRLTQPVVRFFNDDFFEKLNPAGS